MVLRRASKMSSHVLQCCLSCVAPLCHASPLLSPHNSVYTSLPGLSPRTFHSYLDTSSLPSWAIRSLWINPKPVHLTHHWQHQSLTQAGKETLSLMCRTFSMPFPWKNTYLLFSKLMKLKWGYQENLCAPKYCVNISQELQDTNGVNSLQENEKIYALQLIKLSITGVRTGF